MKVGNNEITINGSITKIEKGTCDSFVIEIAYDFNYTGNEQVFNVQYNGVYKIEAWGAQGGTVYSDYWKSPLIRLIWTKIGLSYQQFYLHIPMTLPLRLPASFHG